MLSRRADIRFLFVSLCSALLCFSSASIGQAAGQGAEKESEIEFDSRMYLMISGYYDNLKEGPVGNPDNILELEETGLLMELNSQIKTTYMNNYMFSADVSYQYCPGPGTQKENDTHFSALEFFFDFLVKERLYLKAGKKRESWSVGNVFFPLDIINPPKNPLDPSKSREGSYLGLAEIPLGTSAFSLAYFPRVEYDPDDKDGIPKSMDLEDGGLGVRSYFLVYDTDLSLIYYRIDRIPTLKRNYFGLTANRFFGYLGAYVELLGHTGSDAEFVRQNEAGDYYFPDQDERVMRGKADKHFYANFSAGTSYTFSDDTKVGVEYLRNSEGYDQNDFDEFYDFLEHNSELYLQAGDEGTKNKLLKGSSILQNRLRRNYLGASVDRPNTFDDFFPRLMAIICLDDGSFVIGGRMDYFVRDDTTVKLLLGCPAGAINNEYGLKPDEYKVTLEVKYYW